MPFREDSPFDKKPVTAVTDLENRNEVEKPLLQDEVLESGQEVEDTARGAEVGEDCAPHCMSKHVHFSQSLQRALEEKEWDEEQGGAKEDMEAEEPSMSWDEYWEWVKAETKCYANYICPVVIVNTCIVALVVTYFWTRKG